MKPLHLAMGLSLIANVAVWGWWLSSANSATGSNSKAASGLSLVSVANRAQESKAAAAAAAASREQIPADYSLKDLESLRERLRAAGLPPRLVRGILSELVKDHFAQQRVKLIYPPGMPWHRQGMISVGSALKKKLVDISDEEKQALRSLLGSEAVDDPETLRMLDKKYLNFVSPEKFAQVSKVWEDYLTLREKALAADTIRRQAAPRDQWLGWGGDLINEMELLGREQMADLKAMLTPEELAMHEVVHSNGTHRLRYGLQSIDVTDEEFRAMHTIQSEYDAKFATSIAPEFVQMFAGHRPEAIPAQDRVLDQTRTLLGGARFNDYLSKVAHGYADVLTVAKASGLSSDVALAAWRVQRDTQAGMVGVGNNAALTDAQKTQAVAVLRQSAFDQTVALMGLNATEAYRRRNTSYSYFHGVTRFAPFPVLLAVPAGMPK